MDEIWYGYSWIVFRGPSDFLLRLSFGEVSIRKRKKIVRVCKVGFDRKLTWKKLLYLLFFEMFSCRIYGLEIVKNMSCCPVWKNKFLFLKLISKCFQIHKWIETLTSGIILNFLIFLMNFMQLEIRFDKSDPSFFLPSESFEYHIWELI